jgi:hypothetical protein
VRRDADRARLLLQRAGDALANPPVGVGAEAIALAPLELLDGASKPDVAFLDQVEHGQAAMNVLASDAYDEAQVGFGELAARCRVALLDPLGQLDLLFSTEDLEVRDFAKIEDLVGERAVETRLGRVAGRISLWRVGCADLLDSGVERFNPLCHGHLGALAACFGHVVAFNGYDHRAAIRISNVGHDVTRPGVTVK